jgi:molecular chaperone DnaJ
VASNSWLEKDFYALLGVGHDASEADVKKAYRKLARKLHPDATPGDQAAEKRFKEISEAYAVLSDPEQRHQYDAMRAMATGGPRFTAGGPGGAGSANGFEDLFGGLFTGGPGGFSARAGTAGPGGAAFEDLLGGLFGAGEAGPGGFRSTRGARPGRDIEATTRIGFRQAVEGTTVALRLDGAAGSTVTTRLPAGVRDGQKVRLRGKGRPSETGGPAGDLVLTVLVEPHPVFSRHGDDLRVTVPVSFDEAALGADIEVPTFDGTTVRVRVPAGSSSGRTLRVRGRGVATRAGGKGDLLVTLQVVVPQRLDGVAREAVETFRAATTGDDPRAELLRRAKED